MTLTPLVSIITPVYNGAEHLEKAIASVLGQTYRHFEYIIIDGGSSDGTVDIIKRHERFVTDWVSRPDGGIYFAMNDGIARSRGDIVGIINSDDWYEKDALRAIVDAYRATEPETVLYGLTRYYDEGGLDMILSYDHSRLPTRMINHPACFIPGSLYRKFGGFDTRYRVAADYDLLLRLYRHGVGFQHVEAILANFRGGGYSSRHSSAGEVLRIQREHGFLTQNEYVRKTGLLAARRLLGHWTR